MLRLLSPLALLLLTPAAAAQLRLPTVFSDGMVLQREATAPVWGWAEPGQEVSVRGSWDGAVAALATADAEGRWRASLSTPAAGAADRRTCAVLRKMMRVTPFKNALTPHNPSYM